MHKKKLTIGFACFENVQGPFFTLTNLRLNCIKPEFNDRVEILVIDDAPVETEHLRNLTNLAGGRYIHRPKNAGPAHAKNTVFENATGDYVLLLDAHVIVSHNAISYILDLIDRDAIGKDIIVGLLCNESAQPLATHLDPILRNQFLGCWAIDPDLIKKDAAPKPVWAHGSALMLVDRRHFVDTLGKFHQFFFGFGSEESYIHEQNRKHGGQTICHPAIKWIHRFVRTEKISYPLEVGNKMFNMLVTAYEHNWSAQQILNHFQLQLPPDEFGSIMEMAKCYYPDIFTRPDGYVFEEKFDA